MFGNPFKLQLLALGSCLAAALSAPAQVLRIEVAPTWQGRELKPGEKLSGSTTAGLSVSRLDFLLSKLALRRADGSWLESEDWHRFLSLEKGRRHAEADGTPAEDFTGIRFQVGVPPKENAGDAAQWPPEHALNPEVCGLHWGWQGGYVFLALEGRWQRPDGQLGGFSYHIANDENLTSVELPVDFRGGGPVTLRLALDAAVLLGGVDFPKDGDSTHSRTRDALLVKLTGNLARAFRVEAVSYDLFQTPAVTEKAAPPPPGTTPLQLAVTQRFPQVALPVDNPLTEEGVALGERLFHDTRLSINNTQSCSSCHSRAHALTDSRPVSLGAQGQAGKRNAMPLFNLAWAREFFWDGRAKTLREQVLMPIQDAHEMNETLENVVAKLAGDSAHFHRAFGSAEITPERIAKALEQFLLSQISQNSRFDRAARKVAELTQEEKRGLQLFVTEHDPARGLFGADCFHCHGGTLFTDHQFRNNGLDLTPTDLGRMLVTGDAADRGKFKTPSLRNIAVTAPYMHDGRFTTLEEVVEHYSGPMPRSTTLDPNLAKHPDTGIQLSAADKRALVAFLKTLTDDAFLAVPERAVTQAPAP